LENAKTKQPPKKSQACFTPNPSLRSEISSFSPSTFTRLSARPPYINPALSLRSPPVSTLQCPASSSPSLPLAPLSSPLEKNTIEKRQKKHLPFYIYPNKIKKRKRERGQGGGEE